MKARGSQAGRRAGRAGEAEARARLGALFERFDVLTPDELARIGLERHADASRATAREAVATAARASGRSGLVATARRRAREALLSRYSQGGFHPTWLALNWGISQGTTPDRVAIIRALEDAAAVAVVADLVEPEVVEELSVDADHVMGLAVGDVSEGSAIHVLSAPPPEYRDPPARWLGVVIAALIVGDVAAGVGGVAFGWPVAMVVAIVVVATVIASARRRSARPPGMDAP